MDGSIGWHVCAVAAKAVKGFEDIGRRQAPGKAYCVKIDTAGLSRMVVGLTVCHGHRPCDLQWPLESPGCLLLSVSQS